LRSTLCDVLLIAADWQSRALVLAELREAGYSVIAAPALRHAYRALLGRRVHPRVILLDVSADNDATPEYVEQLYELAPGIPLILLTGAYDAKDWQPILESAAGNLRKPVSVGEVVKEVRRHLTGTREHGNMS
jgi:DNA-binding NtrC family response regulator